ncbi:MAG: hypothetical protein ACI9DC_000360 [Gammaproteobacteria bacterium]
MNFYVAYVLSALSIGLLLDRCLQRITASGRVVVSGLIAASLPIPTGAAIFEEHAGLI